MSTEIENPATSVQKSLDEFLMASAELAIQHVLTQAKAMIATLELYVVGERAIDYNDEYHYPTGGITIKKFFLSEADAKAWCSEEDRKYLADDESIGWVQGDDNWDTRYEWAEKQLDPSKNESYYDVTFKQLKEWCDANGEDYADYAPNMHSYQKVEAG